MTYGVMIGSNLFIGTSGVLTVETEADDREFFRIREINRVRSQGSYLVVDCDIKEPQGNREVKLFKSKPVASDLPLVVECVPGYTQVSRQDGTLVIRVDEVNPQDPCVPKHHAVVVEKLKETEAILRITGDFYAGPHHVVATEADLRINGNTFHGNVSMEAGGLRLTSSGLSFG